MNKSQLGLFETLQRVQVFLTENAEACSPVSRGKARAELDELIVALMHEEATRVGATFESRSHTAQLRRLRSDLRIRHLKPIVAVARVSAPHVPFLSALRVPKKNASDLHLIADATSTAQAISQDQRLFLEHRFPEDFVEQLIAATGAVQSTGDRAAERRLTSVCATHAIARLVKSGRELIHLLDALVLSRLSTQPGLASAWRMCTAVRRTPKARRRPTLNQEHPCTARTEPSRP